MFTYPDISTNGPNKDAKDKNCFKDLQSLPNSPFKTLKLEDPFGSSLKSKRNSLNKMSTRSIYYSSKIEDVIEKLWRQKSPEKSDF